MCASPMQLAVGPGVSHWWSRLMTMQVRPVEGGDRMRAFKGALDWWEEAGSTLPLNGLKGSGSNG